jgi:hypothetical protein
LFLFKFVFLSYLVFGKFADLLFKLKLLLIQESLKRAYERADFRLEGGVV